MPALVIIVGIALGFAAARSGDFDGAVASWELFLKERPESERASEAQGRFILDLKPSIKAGLLLSMGLTADVTAEAGLVGSAESHGGAGDVQHAVARYQHAYGENRGAARDQGAGHPADRLTIFQGGGAGISALVGGNVDIAQGFYSEFRGHLDGGKVAPLAVAAASRMDFLKDMPTFNEALAGNFQERLDAIRNNPKLDISDDRNFGSERTPTHQMTATFRGGVRADATSRALRAGGYGFARFWRAAWGRDW